MSEWIDVNEKLPERYVRVLVYCSFFSGKGKEWDAFISYTIPSMDKKTTVWEITVNFKCVVTHWTYFPKPPEKT